MNWSRNVLYFDIDRNVFRDHVGVISVFMVLEKEDIL